MNLIETENLGAQAAISSDAAVPSLVVADDGSAVDNVPWTTIRPASSWQLINLRECWHYRDLLFLLIRRDVQVRYRQAVLGAAWAVLQPTLMMIIFTTYFSRLAKLSSGQTPYPIFAYTGLLPWSFFSSAVSMAASSIITSEKLISKIYIPRILIPIAAVGAAIVDFAIAMTLLAVLMLFYRVPPGPVLYVFPMVFGLIVLAALGTGSLIAALNVSYRDFRYVVPFMLQIWMFATPTIYMEVNPVTESHSLLHRFLRLNPLTGTISCLRAVILGGPIDWKSLGISTASTVAILIIGFLYFRRTEDRFADII